MKKILTISCISFWIISACTPSNSQQDKSESKVIELEQFSAIDLSDSGSIVTDDADKLGAVNSIEVVDDGLIAICQNRPDAHVTLYDAKTDSSLTVVARGGGPLEMLRVSSISRDANSNLWLVGLMDRKVMKAKYKDSNEAMSVELTFKLPEDCLRGVTDGKGGIIALPTGLRQSRLITLDSNGQVTDSMGSYPNVEIPADVKPNNLIFQSDIAYSPATNKIALACMSWNYINIVDRETKKTIELMLPIDAPIAFERFEMGGAVSYNPKPLWLMFSGVKVTPESFLVGYIGAKVESPEDFGKQVNSILEFDWSGKPLRMFKFANDVVTFSISGDGKTLYTVENNPDPVLYKYQL